MQVGVEERENLTVTGNASITRRSLCVTLLAAILALVFVATLADDADAKRVRNKKGVSLFCEFIGCTTSTNGTGQPFQPPDRFSCRPVAQPVTENGYTCTPGDKAAVISDTGPVAGAVATNFDLNDVLVRSPSAGPPPGPGLEGVATPDLFQCHWDGHPPATHPGHGTGAGLAEHFICEYRQNQQTRVFTVNEIVPTNTDEVDIGGGAPDVLDVDRNADDSLNDVFLPRVGRAVPTAVPAGADAAGEGSAAWLFGLVLAASGAMVGTVVIARRRFMHDS
jgi:hypothetical protein